MTDERLQCEEPNGFVRPRYYAGKLLTVDEFEREQSYHRARQSSHLRRLHGRGTVCGLAVRATEPASRRIIVEKGMAIDCCGREIVVPTDQVVDLPHPDRAQHHRYVVVRYVDVPVDPVPVVGMPGGSAGTEANSVRESFELEVCGPRGLDLGRSRVEPEALRRAGTAGLHDLLVEHVIRPCEPCDDTRVPLARLTIRADEAVTSAEIDNTIRPIVLGADLLAPIVEAFLPRDTL